MVQEGRPDILEGLQLSWKEKAHGPMTAELRIPIHPGFALAEPAATMSVPGHGSARRLQTRVYQRLPRLPREQGTPPPSDLAPFLPLLLSLSFAGGDAASL